MPLRAVVVAFVRTGCITTLRETVTVGREVALRETVEPVRPDLFNDAPAGFPRATRRVARAAVPDADDDVATTFDDDAPDARGLGAWAASASAPATTAAIATKYLQKSAIVFFKTCSLFQGIIPFFTDINQYPIYSIQQFTAFFTQLPKRRTTERDCATSVVSAAGATFFAAS